MGLTVHQERITPALGEKLKKLCPFGAIEYADGKLSVGMGCKLCKLCVKNGEGAISFEEDVAPPVDLERMQRHRGVLRAFQGPHPQRHL